MTTRSTSFFSCMRWWWEMDLEEVREKLSRLGLIVGEEDRIIERRIHRKRRMQHIHTFIIQVKRHG